MKSLFEHFEILEDPRDIRGKKHGLTNILIMTIYGILCGYTDFVNIADFLSVYEEYFVNLLNLENGIPSHDTFSNVFRTIDSKKFMELFIDWIKEVINSKGTHLAIDGKAIKSARDKINGGNTPYIVSAFLCDIGISIGQVKVDDKSNEITAIPNLLDLIDIKGEIITIDAMGTQEDIANKITDKKGFYVLKVKDNQKELKDDIMLRGEVIDNLKKVYDIERLAGKMAYGNANARDMVTLKNSLLKLPEVKRSLANCKSERLKEIAENLDELQDIYQLIDGAIIDDPPMTIKDGGIIKLGYDEEIDTLKTAQIEGKNWLVQLELDEREKTGIKNLKIGFNKVFGYFIEVTKSYLSQVPDRFVRKQTLANAERYITEELKNLENQILGAEEKVVTLEYEAFVQIRDQIAKNIKRLQKTSEMVSNLDVLTSFAEVAEDMNYCMPEVTSSGTLDIKKGRHPVIEKILGPGSFVENDTYLDKQDSRLSIITGPNMAGKSTYMRQVALITLMAQVGSFVPAESAKIGVVDKIFTRVGASDDLSMGQSTFMVEMMEVATILKEATSNSLVVLDEIGRGTSTYDGLSIAWAVAEFIGDKEKCGAKTLFATHYHELTELEDKIEGIKNYSIAVKEKGEDIIFLRKIVRGGTDESYGIHVARLAGVPKVVTQKADEILRSLERKNILTGQKQEKQDKKQVEGQFDLYNYKLAEIAHEVDKINLNELTPIDALNTLVRMKEKMK